MKSLFHTTQNYEINGENVKQGENRLIIVQYKIFAYRLYDIKVLFTQSSDEHVSCTTLDLLGYFFS